MAFVLLLIILARTVLAVRTIECSITSCDQDRIGDSICQAGCMNEICNFDSPVTMGSPFQKESSDCLAICLTLSSCIFELLGDGKCDSGINNIECNSTFCGWDWGDCGYCSSGCFKNDLENSETCKQECNHPNCNLHGGLCVRSIQGGYCSPGCFKEDLENQICEKACFNEACGFDNLNIECQKCQPWMIENNQCDYLCAYPEYNYDNGSCDCTPDCPYEKQFNNECDWECYVSKCQYDNYAECPNTCAIGCRTDITYESCVPECLIWKCDYDNDKCDPKEKLFAFFSQMINQDIKIAHSLQIDCLLHHPGCTYEKLSNEVCNSECNIKDCAFDMGDCGSSCELGCNKCYKENGELKCLECEEDYYQLYTLCVSECTRGFIPSVKLNRKVCEPPLDNTSYDNPEIFYVSQDSNLGDLENTFSSLNRALLNITRRYTRVYLMNFDGTDHILESLNAKDSTGRQLKNSQNPLSSYGIQFWESIDILPLYCSESVTQYCYSEGEKARIRWKGLEAIELYINKNMNIQDVEFDGYNIITQQDCTDFDIYCTYCPYITYKGLKNGYYDDKGQKFTWKYASQTDCDRYQDTTLFNIVQGTLSLTRVNFVNWRAGFFSLITINNGSLILNQVDFINIKSNNQPYSAIITSYQCESSSYDCSSLKYYYGSVKLLNNGYEYNDNNYFSGFFYGKGMKLAEFSYMDFEQNLAYTGKSVQYQSYATAGSLFYIDNFLYFSLKFSSFKNSILDRLCYLKILTDNENKYTFDSKTVLDTDHVVISKNFFTNIFGDILKLDFYTVLPNMKLIENTFESIVYDEHLIYIALAEYDNELYDAGTGLLETGFYDYIGYQFTRLLQMNRNHIQECYGSDSLIHLQNLFNVEMGDLSINHSLQNPDYDLKTEIIQSLVYQYFIKESTYISKDFNSPRLNHTQIHYGNACYFYRIAGFTSNYLILSDNYSGMGGTDALFVNIEGIFDVEKIEIFNNIANSKKSGTGLSFSKTSIRLDLENVTAMNNTNYLGYGTFYLENFNSPDISAFRISNSYFLNNSAGYGSAMAISASNAEIIDVIFEGNIVTSSYGGAIYFNQHTSPGDSLFTVFNCEFSGNIVNSGLGGAIAINNSLNIEVWKLRLVFRDSKFHNNTSLNDASIIYISNEIKLHKDSLVQNCEFKSNRSDRKANILLAYRSGILTFDTCTFLENESSKGIVMYIISNEDTIENPSKIMVRNSTFIGNKPINNPYASLIHVGDSIFHSTLETHNVSFKENSGTCVNVEYGEWIDSYSNFINNEVYQAAVARISNQGEAELSYVSILDNTSTLRGGAFLLTSKSSLKVSNSTITRNKSHQDGGAVFMDNESIIMLESTEIKDNEAIKKGSFIYSSECNVQGSYITHSRIFGNKSKKGGVISLLNSIFNISGSEIYNNVDKEITPGIILAFSTLNANFTKFTNQAGVLGSAIYATSQSEVYLDGCTFENLHTTGAGGAIYGYYSIIKLHNSMFSLLSAESGGSILVDSNSILEIAGSDFKNSTSLHGGGLIKSFESEIIIRNSLFDTFNSTGIEAEKLHKFEIFGSIFQNGSGNNGGVVFCNKCSGLNISNSEFKNNIASYGGAVYITSTQIADDPSSCIFSSNIFAENSAFSGGSIYSNNINLSFYNNTFAMNRAGTNETELEGNGGALKIECYDVPNCMFNFTQNIFIENSAYREGGSISWKHFEPIMNDNIFKNNTAEYGNDIASFAARLGIVDDLNLVVEAYSFLRMDTNVASGQAAQPIRGALIDNYGQIVTTDSTSLVELISSNTTVTLSGEIRQKANKGIFEFSDFIISGIPDSSIMISIYTSDGILTLNLKSQDFQINNRLDLKLYLRECIVGEKESDEKCIPCPVDTYSYDPDEGTCNLCLEGAKCYGKCMMVPRKGYWRSQQFSETFLECPNKDACLGSPDYPDLAFTGECKEGYIGNLCNTCDKNYSKTMKNRCDLCPSKTSNIFKLIGIAVFALILSGFIVKTTLNSAYKPKSLLAIYIKIFLNYLQLVTLTAGLDLNWPGFATKFLYYQEETGNVNEQMLSFDCLIYHYNNQISPEDIYYIQLIVLFLSPIFILCIAFLFWASVAIYRNNFRPLKEELVSTIIILLFLIHPNIVKNLFLTFSCMEIEPGEYWIKGNYDIRCWDDKHTSYILLYVVPGILIWGVGIPAVCLIFLIRNRKKLDNLQVRLKFGFLFNGYNRRHYYWDFFILYRKLLIIFCSTFLNFISTSIQALTISLLLIISLFIHLNQSPFNDENLNEMEKRSVLVATVTVYFGLYYMTEDLNYIMKVILFIGIIGVNTYFIYFWILKVVHYSVKFAHKIPCLKNIIPFKLVDGYSGDLFVSRKHLTNQGSLLNGASCIFSSSVVNLIIEDKYRIEPTNTYEDLKNIQNSKSLYLMITKYKNSCSEKTTNENPLEEIKITNPTDNILTFF